MVSLATAHAIYFTGVFLLFFVGLNWTLTYWLLSRRSPALQRRRPKMVLAFGVLLCVHASVERFMVIAFAQVGLFRQAHRQWVA